MSENDVLNQNTENLEINNTEVNDVATDSKKGDKVAVTSAERKKLLNPRSKYVSASDRKANKSYMDECFTRWEDMYQRTKFPFEKLPVLKIGRKSYDIYKDEGERFRRYNVRIKDGKTKVLADMRIKENEIMNLLPFTVNCQDACKTVIKNMYDYKISYALMQLAYNAKSDVRQKWLEQKCYTQAKLDSLEAGKPLSDVDLSQVVLKDNFVSLYDVNIYSNYNKRTESNVLSAHIPTADGRKLVLNEQSGVSMVMRRKANSSIAQYDTTYRKGNVQLDSDFTYEVYYSRNHFNKMQMTADELNDVYINYLGSLVSKQAQALGADKPKLDLPKKNKEVQRDGIDLDMSDESQMQLENG